MNKTYTVAITDYMLKGGDGYAMFVGQRVLVGAGGRRSHRRRAGEIRGGDRRDIAPAVEGRHRSTP